jgi:hypothetical protein
LGSPCQVEFRHSHISEETVSRAPRAFSRAAASDPTTELALRSSRPSRLTTRADVNGPSMSGMPITASSDRQAESSEVHGSASIRCRCTSRMRAVSSARST